jgi:hypothetical protein
MVEVERIQKAMLAAIKQIEKVGLDTLPDSNSSGSKNDTRLHTILKLARIAIGKAEGG